MSSSMDVDKLPLVDSSKPGVRELDVKVKIGTYQLSIFNIISTVGILLGIFLALCGLVSIAQIRDELKISARGPSSQDSQVGFSVWPMCDCSRTARLHTRGIITYHTCLVDTTNDAMNPDTGVFTTGSGQDGIYQITFTAKFVANSNGRFGAWCDVIVNDQVVADSQREYNGNSRTESSTHTVVLLHKLREGDKVHVMFNKDGSSFIHSDDDHDVHFTVRKVSELPENV